MRRYARCWWYFTLHIINVEKNVSRLLFHFLLPYLCMHYCHIVGLVRMVVLWVCFDVLFFITEFHFLFSLIFILFWFACINLCCWCFPLGVYFSICHNTTKRKELFSLKGTTCSKLWLVNYWFDTYIYGLVIVSYPFVFSFFFVTIKYRLILTEPRQLLPTN